MTVRKPQTEPETLGGAVRTGDRDQRSFLLISVGLVLAHAFFMLFRYGRLPSAPLVPDEVIINDAAVAIAHGHGYVSESLLQSKYGLDHVFAHFPPVYPYIESLAFRFMGVSVYSLRFTTTIMSLIASVLLLLAVRRFCAAGWLGWRTGIIVNAIFCTNASLISLERMARMESTVSAFEMLALLGLAYALTLQEGRRRWPWTLLAAASTAATVAVHPVAATAVMVPGAILLFVVPAKPAVRVGILAVMVLVPTALAFAVYRSQLVFAVHQFLAIAHDSQSVNPTSYEWFIDAISNHGISAVNRNSFMIFEMVLLAMAPFSAWRTLRQPGKTRTQRRFAIWFAVGCVVDFVLMLTAMRMDERRCQFLLGLLLLGNAIGFQGTRRVRSWQMVAAGLLVLVQLGGVCFYLSARVNRVPEMNANRYLSLVRRIPPGVSIGAAPGLWLDLKEDNRPFSLILYGLDGEENWQKDHENPLHQFDVILLENYYTEGRHWLEDEALQGRTEHDFIVGSHVVSVYTRPGVDLLPEHPSGH